MSTPENKRVISALEQQVEELKEENKRLKSGEEPDADMQDAKAKVLWWDDSNTETVENYNDVLDETMVVRTMEVELPDFQAIKVIDITCEDDDGKESKRQQIFFPNLKPNIKLPSMEYTLKVEDELDLERMVLMTPESKLCLPELDFEIPWNALGVEMYLCTIGEFFAFTARLLKVTLKVTGAGAVEENFSTADHPGDKRLLGLKRENIEKVFQELCLMGIGQNLGWTLNIADPNGLCWLER
jgi:hypothetical protein